MGKERECFSPVGAGCWCWGLSASLAQFLSPGLRQAKVPTRLSQTSPSVPRTARAVTNPRSVAAVVCCAVLGCAVLIWAGLGWAGGGERGVQMTRGIG